jgi:glycosyltransferase involved in cell wall biosynthesis
MNNRPRVAIFQSQGFLQSQVVNAVKVLTAHGYAVDVFLNNVSQQFEVLNAGNGDNEQVVRVINLPQSSIKNAVKTGLSAQVLYRVRKIQHRLALYIGGVEHKSADLLLRLFHVSDLDSLFPPSLFDQTKKYMTGLKYRCLIGIERHGLAWAGHMAEQFNIPLVYWSLELYTKDIPAFTGIWFKRLKRLEQKYHKHSQATIVQDADRAAVLLNDNGVKDTRLLFVPVSVLGPPEMQKTNYLHRMLNIPLGKKIILVFGMLHTRRFTDELVRLAQNFPEEWVVVVHGHAFGRMDSLRELEVLNTQKRVIISTQMVPSSEIGDLMASADIGLVFYSKETMNEYLTGRSSEKAALYARAGVPMIAFDYPSFMDVFETYGCGRCISSLDELTDQIRLILKDYQGYRAGAFRAYVETYEFSKHFSNVERWIDGQ